MSTSALTPKQRQRRSRLLLLILLLGALLMTIIGVLVIRAGIQNEALQQQLEEIREREQGL